MFCRTSEFISKLFTSEQKSEDGEVNEVCPLSDLASKIVSGDNDAEVVLGRRGGTRGPESVLRAGEDAHVPGLGGPHDVTGVYLGDLANGPEPGHAWPRILALD